MEPFDYVKAFVLNLRLYSCCWCVPVRIGLIATGYFNAIIATMCVIGTANDSISPTLMQVQMKIMPDFITKSVVMLAYITEVCFSVLCLCGIYRKDQALLRVYMYYCATALMLSIMVYSIVILAIDLIIQVIMIGGILFQTYVLLLVRSAIVEIKWENKQSNLPTLVMSTLFHEKEPMKDQISIKSQEKDNQEKQEIEEVKVETVEVKSETVKDPKSSGETEKKNETVEVKSEAEKGPKSPGETETKNGHKDADGKLETVKEEVSTSAENKSSIRRVFLRP